MALTLGEMIHELMVDEEIGVTVLDQDQSEQIIAALQAGHQMREFISTKMTQKIGCTIAWDVAVGKGK